MKFFHKKYIFTAHMAMLMLLSGLVSCSDDDNQGFNNPDRITFSIATDSITQALSRATQYADQPLVLLNDNGNDSLYLHPSVTEISYFHDNDENVACSRGIQIKANTDFDSFTVTAITDDNKNYIDKVKVSRLKSGVWTTDDSYFWPGSQTLNFYAYTPCADDATEWMTNVNTDGKKISFDFTTPHGSDDDDAVKQKDIIFAFASKSKSETANGQVNLNFSHALSAIKFVAGDIAGGTVKTITIKNVYGAGKAVYDGTATTVPFTWTLEGDPDKSYTQTFDIAVEDKPSSSTDKQPITDKKAESVFMMIPQSLNDNTEIEVVISTLKDGEKILKGKIKTTETPRWEAGKEYTYTISTSSINWTYVLEVTDGVDTDTENSITIPISSFEGKFGIKSYRYRTNTPSIIEPVGWEMEHTKEEITLSESATSGTTSTDDLFFISSFNTTGTGTSDITSTEDWIVKIYEPTATSDWAGDAQLKASTPKGSETTPYDLSTNGDLESQTTANCYIVDAPGVYKLPLVYGNAIKDGSTNEKAYICQETGADATYRLSTLRDYDNALITNPWIQGNITDATLVWCDAIGAIHDIKLSNDKKYMIFTVDKKKIQQGNAVLAIRDDKGVIMWSWHIWITEHDINDTEPIKGWDTDSKTYQLMKCSVGWVDSKNVSYPQRYAEFKIKQNISGKNAVLKVKQEKEDLDYTDGGSTYYQWGRKDPFIALKKREETIDNIRPHEVGQANYAYKVEVCQIRVKEGIQNPNILYTAALNSGEGTEVEREDSHKWLVDFYENLWNNNSTRNVTDTESIKTVYDPSPRGFKVPPVMVFRRFTNGATTLNGTFDGTSKYTVNTGIGTNKITLIATGQRSDRTSMGGGRGGLWAIEGVYLHSCMGLKNSGDDYISYSLCLRQGATESGTAFNYRFPGAQTMARCVRSIKE